jgi:hypothetical protein
MSQLVNQLSAFYGSFEVLSRSFDKVFGSE